MTDEERKALVGMEKLEERLAYVLWNMGEEDAQRVSEARAEALRRILTEDTGHD